MKFISESFEYWTIFVFWSHCLFWVLVMTYNLHDLSNVSMPMSKIPDKTMIQIPLSAELVVVPSLYLILAIKVIFVTIQGPFAFGSQT